MKKRIAFIVIGVPLGFIVFWIGGLAFTIISLVAISLAAGEYVRLFRMCKYEPAYPLVIGGTALLIIGRAWNDFDSAPWMLTLFIFASMAYHLIAYEQGRTQAGADFGITLGGILYFGWLGGYFVSLRMMPMGMWWFILTIVTTWCVDIGAYLIGKMIGKHPFFPHLSPKKTVEGFFGGIAGGIIGGLLLTLILHWLYGSGTGYPIQFWQAALIGGTLGLVTPLGDLGESMVKRMAGVKDSSHLIPGHGGVWDRIDSWLWGVVVGYYLIIWFF
jgi:phosphatidate cytidylyltransferase